ncbi:hypothetical protein FRC03_009220 [Tulasnella sp. 419]|nr:hypothetical protein FRC03_009220 [Tulasnella sp. 419]
MFTPPPSPLPTHINGPPSIYCESSSSEDEDCSQPSSSSLSLASKRKERRNSPLRQSIALPADDYLQKRTSKRRILIPLMAVVLVVIAVSSKITSSSRHPSVLFGLTRTSPSISAHEDQVLRARAKRKRSIHLSHFRNEGFAADPLVEKRQVETDATMTSSDTPTSTSSTASPSNRNIVNRAVDASDPPAIPDPPFPVPTPFPQSFDDTLSYNFSTTSCASFFQDGFLTNLTFRACRPFSLLLPSSSAFFEAQDNLTTITSVMGGTCNTRLSVDECGGTMDWLAEEIQKDTVCGRDLKDQVVLPVTALNGFRNYRMMRQAGCLVNQRTNTYCFADAVAASSPADFYYYALPLGTPIPGKTQPSCSTCIQSLLSIYATQANNKTMLISKTYSDAADLARNTCGAKYALSVTKDSGSTMEVHMGERWVWFTSVMIGGVILGLGSLSSLVVGGL